jgi:AraC family transcriptional regulator
LGKAARAGSRYEAGVRPAKRPQSVNYHRVQIARARQFMRAHAAEEITLEAIARAAGASMFHFTRVYAAVTRETVFQSLARIRLRVAAERLCSVPGVAVSEVALDAGYRTPSSFNKAFRAAVGVSPSQLRASSGDERKALLARLAPPARGTRRPLSLSRVPEVRMLAPRRFACVRERGPYAEVAPLAWSRLETALTLAGTSLRAHECISASYDDPLAVSEELLRYDAGVVIPSGAPAPPGTVASRLEGGPYAVFEYRGAYGDIAEAFQQIFGGWVLRSRARIRAAPCLEIYRNHPNDVPEHALRTELLVPLETTT